MTRFIRPMAMALLCAALAACAGTSRQPPAPLVALPPPPPVGEPAGVTGLQPAQLRVAFGTPAFVRKDDATQMWRYDGQSCRAFFFLYPDTGALAVRHVETVPRGREIAADQACLDAIRIRPVATPVSEVPSIRSEEHAG
jgi:hypothetical protein